MGNRVIGPKETDSCATVDGRACQQPCPKFDASGLCHGRSHVLFRLHMSFDVRMEARLRWLGESSGAFIIGDQSVGRTHRTTFARRDEERAYVSRHKSNLPTDLF